VVSLVQGDTPTAGVVQNREGAEMTLPFAPSKVYRLIPVDFGQRLQGRARKSTLLKLDNFIELRDFYAENEEEIKAGGLESFYEEAADWMDYAPDTVDKNLDIIRNYPETKLRYWVKNGLSFDHIERG